MQFFYWVILFLFSACSLEPRHSPSQFENTSSESFKATIFFDEIKEKIINPHCLICHSNYSNYQTVKFHLPAIINSVASKRMPLNAPPLPEDLLDLLEAWLDEGAPLEKNEPDESQDIIQPLNPTWDSLSLYVFEPKCFVCHNPKGEAPWVDFSNRSTMIKTLIEHINFSQPENSNLIHRLKDSEEPMPPLPPFSNLPQLTEDEINVVVEWINRGLP